MGELKMNKEKNGNGETKKEPKIKTQIRDELNTFKYIHEKLIEYPIKKANKETFDENGKEIYRILEIQLLLCDKDHPIGRYIFLFFFFYYFLFKYSKFITNQHYLLPVNYCS